MPLNFVPQYTTNLVSEEKTLAFPPAYGPKPIPRVLVQQVAAAQPLTHGGTHTQVEDIDKRVHTFAFWRWNACSLCATYERRYQHDVCRVFGEQHR